MNSTDLNSIVINFDPNQVFLLNICLGILMFGVALDLKITDFKYVLVNIKGVITGVISQWILLHLLTIGLVLILKPEYSLALGMALIAACPGGNVSNYAVHLSGANAALSVILTIISTIFCALSTPFIFSLIKSVIVISENSSINFAINFNDMLSTIAQLILFPLALGFSFVHFMPKWTSYIKDFVKKLSLLIFIGFVIVALIGNLENLKSYVGAVFIIVLIHNGIALMIGYYWSRKIMKLPIADSRTISIETGIQNSGLALILIFNFFDGLGGMALIAAWWSIWHLITSLTLALYWKRSMN